MGLGSFYRKEPILTYRKKKNKEIMDGADFILEEDFDGG